MSNSDALLLASSYRDTVIAASQLAASGIIPLLEGLEGADFATWTRELRPAMLQVGEQFSGIAADAAIAYYDEMRSLFPPTDAGDYKAKVLANPAELLSLYRDNIAYTFNSVPTARSYEAVKSETLATVQDHVKRTSFSNMVENSKKDKALVIITYIPSAKACRFCRSIIAGSRSYRRVGGGGVDFMASIYARGSQFHKRCACTPVPRFVSSMSEEFYDTPRQVDFNNNFKKVVKQAETLSMPIGKPKEIMVAMDSYYKSIRAMKTPVFDEVTEKVKVVDMRKNVIGPRYGASDDELLKIKNALAGNNFKPYIIPS